MSFSLRLASTALLLILSGCAGVMARDDCPPAGAWIEPVATPSKPVDPRTVIAEAARAQVVLLGELHDNAEHHRWQLQTIAALHGQRPDMAIGLEMFPRRVQKVLDRWVAGELSEEAFLKESDWANVWKYDWDLYLPILHFARMNRVPLLALNVERTLVRAASQKGFDAVPEAEREGVGKPAAPAPGYVDHLHEVFSEHGAEGHGKDKAAEKDDPVFTNFIQGQLTWDRAMAEKLAGTARGPGKPLVVGIMGTGHIQYGWGVPHQLAALGVDHVASLVPVDRADNCERLRPGLADAAFMVEGGRVVRTPRQKLGVGIEEDESGAVKVVRVVSSSIAEAAGVKAGDVVVEVAGEKVDHASDIVRAVERHAPGTWLPLKVRRDGGLVEIIAKFPAKG